MPFDPGALAPGQDGHRSQFRAVVRNDHRGTAALGDHHIQFPDDALAGKGGVGNERQAFPRVIVDHGQNAEPPPVRIPTHSVGCSDNIRSVIPGYPVT